MAVQIQWRRDTAANWTAANPILAQGEAGYETDTGKLKMGDGATAWNALAYVTAWGGGGGGGGVVLSAGAQSASTGTIVFSNSNNITFGMTANSRITGSYNFNASAGLYSQNLNSLKFADSNGISFGLSVSTITASHNGLTSQSNPAFSAGAASSEFQTLSFQDSNGLSFSNNAGAIRITHALQYTSATSNITSNALHSSASRVINIVAATNNTGGGTASLSSNVSFSAANGLTFYTSAGNAIVGSHNALTTARASNDAIGLNTALTAGPVAMTANSSGLSLNFSSVAGTTSGFAGNLISGSMTLNTAGLNLSLNHPAWLTTARASNDAVGLNTAQTNVTWTVNSSGISLNASGYAGTGTSKTGNALITLNSNGLQFNGTSLAGVGTTFNGANISGSMTMDTGGLQLSMSVAAPGAAAENNWFNLLGANTAGNTTASGSTIGMSGINVTLSGTNGSQIVVSGPAPLTYSGFNPYADYEKQAGQYGQGTLQFDPARVPNCIFDRAVIPLINTNSSNSSGSHTLSFWLGLYTRNDSTLSLLQSVSSSTALTHSGTAGSYSLYSGNRLFTIPMSATLTEGDYWIGFVSRTTSGGANGSYSNLIMSNIASNFLGFFGSSHNTTQQLTLGQGVYTATTSGMPGSVAFSEIRGSDSAARRAVFVMFANSTV